MVFVVDNYRTLERGERHAAPSLRQRHLRVIGINGNRPVQNFLQFGRRRNATKRPELRCVPLRITPHVNEE